MYWNRFDICEAWWVFASLYHGGQYSEIYKIFGRLARMQFRPSRGLGLDSLEENAREIFEQLVDSHNANLTQEMK